MSDAETPRGDEQRIEELMRVNAELAAEIRSLSLGRVAEPRSSTIPSARRVTRLAAEREALAAELEAAKAEIERIEEHNQELGREAHALAEQVARLSSGFRGAMRVGLARLFRR
jgi:cell division protein FtsB